MNKRPFKMWLWGKDGIFVASNRPPDPGDDLIAISVYPADQVPEPVAWRYRYWKDGAWRFAVRAADPEDIDGDYEEQPLYLGAPPSTIRQEEREP